MNGGRRITHESNRLSWTWNGSSLKEILMSQRDFGTGLQNVQTIEITVTGRSSGRSLSYPIWFTLDGNTLYLLPVRGSDTEWYKNLRKTLTIGLSARGKKYSTNAQILTDEGQVREVAEKFRRKYGNLENYYPKIDVAVEVPLQ